MQLYSRSLALFTRSSARPTLARFTAMDDSTSRPSNIDEQSAPSQRDSKGALDGSNGNNEAGHLSSSILPHILNLYNCTSGPSDYEIYAQDATFEDPLMCAHGVKQIKSAFYSIPKITIDNVQHYKILGRQIDMVSLIKLEVKDGKVVRHEDLWDKKPLWNRESVKVPVVGRFIEKVRRGNMALTHAFMGFGKDPQSTGQ